MKIAFKYKLFFKMMAGSLCGLFIIACFQIYELSSLKKKELLSEDLGNSFAILNCQQGRCQAGTYVDLEPALAKNGAPQVTTIAATGLAAISEALSRSNLPKHLIGKLALYEIGDCNHLLRDSPEKFYSLNIQAVEPLGKSSDGTCVEKPSKEKCEMRVRLLELESRGTGRVLINTLDRWSYYGSSMMWTYL